MKQRSVMVHKNTYARLRKIRTRADKQLGAYGLKIHSFNELVLYMAACTEIAQDQELAIPIKQDA